MADFRSGGRGGFGGGRSSSRGGFGGGRGGGFGGRGGGRGGFRDRDSRGPVEMHDATCAKCGKECQVPFRPTGDKPVYCSACFEQNNPREGRSSGSGSGISQDQFKQLNDKLDKILSVLEQIEIVDDSEDELEEDEDSEDEEESA